MRKNFLCVFLSLLILGSCSSTPTPKGILYTKTRGPLAITSNGDIRRSGKASVEVIMGLFVVGDVSVNKICEDNNIKRIHHIDYEDELILFGVYQKYTVIVYGE